MKKKQDGRESKKRDKKEEKNKEEESRGRMRRKGDKLF